MTKYRLLYGDAHDEVVEATPDIDRIVWRTGIWQYMDTGAVGEDGYRVARAIFT